MNLRASDVPTEVVPGFALLFAASVRHPLRRERLDHPAAVIGGTAFSASQLEDYQQQRDETEVHVLGREFIAAGRLTHHAIGRLHLPVAADDARAPAAADVHLFTHVAGVALWAADALVSLGVVIGGALYLWQGWGWIDPVMSLAIAVVIVVGTWNLFKQSLHLLFDGVPEGIDLQAVRALLLGLPGVADVHDLHVWAMGTSQVALTAHMVLSDPAADLTAVLCAAEEELHEHFEIRHATLQLEPPAYARLCVLQGAAGCAQPQPAT